MSAMLARMVCVRSDTIATLIDGGNDASSCGSAFLIHRPLRAEPAGQRLVFRRDDGAPDVADADRCPVAVSQDVVVESAGRGQLIVGEQREGMLTAVQRALRLVDRAVGKRRTHRLQVQPRSGKLRRVDLDPNGRVLLAAETDEPDAGHL
jgi:hypothetical protein